MKCTLFCLSVFASSPSVISPAQQFNQETFKNQQFEEEVSYLAHLTHAVLFFCCFFFVYFVIQRQKVCPLLSGSLLGVCRGLKSGMQQLWVGECTLYVRRLDFDFWGVREGCKQFCGRTLAQGALSLQLRGGG